MKETPEGSGSIAVVALGAAVGGLGAILVLGLAIKILKYYHQRHTSVQPDVEVGNQEKEDGELGTQT